jgi:hypothetical protein
MKPLVSIYNAEEWIAEAVQSAIGQNWPPQRAPRACVSEHRESTKGQIAAAGTGRGSHRKAEMAQDHRETY